MKCLDEYVCISIVRKYFTNDAWKLVENVIETMKKVSMVVFKLQHGLG